jgi:phosphohistidine phosphatase
VDLILWRHAEAEDIRHGMEDKDRQLTAKGRKQAQKMAAWLNALLPHDSRILASPAMRTVQTAKALEREFEISDALFTSASVNDHLAASGWPTGGCTVLVGHQPTLGQLAALLMSGHPHQWAIKKGAVWWLRSVGGPAQLASLHAAATPAALWAGYVDPQEAGY